MRVSLFTVLLVAQTAAAQPGKEVTREFQAGVDAFRLGKHDEARAHLERAKQLDPKLPGPNRFLAAVAQAQGRFADCVTAARTAIELNPASAEIADTRKLHDDCRRSAGRPSYSAELGDKAAIGITANVSGATVTIDNLVYGATPIEPRPITPGSHHVELAKPGYRPRQLTVNVVPGVVTDLEVDMEVDPDAVGTPDGTAKAVPREAQPVTLNPNLPTARLFGAELLIDGEVMKHAAADGVGYKRGGFQVRVPAGMHVVELRVPDMDPWRRRVIVEADRENAYFPTLVDTAARERTRARGMWFTAAGLGFALAGGVAVYQIMQDDRRLWKGLAGTAFGLSAVTLGVGIWALVRGQRPDLRAPPPLAAISNEGGVITTTGLRF